ncbi:MAG: glycoside hydrolase family 15 protein [Planctomycetota bacterium]
MVHGLGLIGNCSYNALVDEGKIVWLCWPRFDSSFVFGGLLDEERGGAFSIEPTAEGRVSVDYLENTNILRTEFRGDDWAFEVLDFAPRFLRFDRWYRPTMLVRIVRPLMGEPRVRIRCEPVYDYGRKQPQCWAASNHLQYGGLPAPVRLTTNAPLTYIGSGQPFLLTRDLHLVLTWGDPLEAPLEETAEAFLVQTRDSWRRWVKSGRVPREYQREVIRSALTLKLHQYDDTGALIAATTTSLPESPGSGRTWDYRFCWLRDAYFTLNAFERLGYVEEMERFLLYLRSLCDDGARELQPVYGIGGESALTEVILDHLRGHQGEGPVRIGNQAHEQLQNDVYGEMILAISRMLLDVRFAGVEGVVGARRLVENLLHQIEVKLEQPDAGLWELRGQRQLHSFTLLTHWAGARRAHEVASHLGMPALRTRAADTMQQAASLLMQKCWDPKRGVMTQSANGPDVDASSLLALHFGFLAGNDPRARSLVAGIQQDLALPGGLLRRYAVRDDFGEMEAAFTVCSFWLAEALAITGQIEQGRAVFDQVLELDNGLGLFSEDIMTDQRRQSGNFPQTYSHVGLINAAFRLSPPWDH